MIFFVKSDIFSTQIKFNFQLFKRLKRDFLTKQILEENKESICQAQLREDYLKGLPRARRVSLAASHPNLHKNLSAFKNCDFPRTKNRFSKLRRRSEEVANLSKSNRLALMAEEDNKRVRNDFCELRKKFSEDTISQRMYDFKVILFVL